MEVDVVVESGADDVEEDEEDEEEVGALSGSYSLSSTSVVSVRKMVRSPEFEPPIDTISFHHREVCESTYTDHRGILGS